jgi:cytosine/adenosine deaminase-related metal-dependent hydrolase
MNQGPFSLRARYVVPVESHPFEDGVVRVEGGVITAIEPARRSSWNEDLGDVALLPGCVNAHTHLEFSTLDAPLGYAGISFPHWIREVIQWRRTVQSTSSTLDAKTAIRQGISESRRHGVTAVGDIATDPAVARFLNEMSVPGVTFFELLGLAGDQTERLLNAAAHFVSGLGEHKTSQLRAISPHSPYTINLDCLSRLVALSADAGVPLAMHLAESQEELDLLAHQSGALVELLEGLGAWHPQLFRRGLSPADYLRVLSQAHRAAVIHGNYFDSPEIEFLARHRHHMSVVYCPRTHAFFGHPPYPLRKLTAAGVVVALGTDSRASNPDLSIFGEMRQALDAHPAIWPGDALRMGTLNAARAIGQDHLCGSLGVGKRADLVAVAVRHRAADPCEAIFADPVQVLRVYSGGEEVKATP